MNKTLHLSIILPVDPAAVYQAITNASSLQKWLTEKARVSLSDGIFELWGRYLPGAPDRAATKLAEAIENRLLGFSWNYKTHTLPVALELASGNKGTILTLAQEIPERPTGEASFADFWGLSFENLRRLLLHGSEPLFCDFSTAHHREAMVTAQINKPPKEVFTGLIDPQQLERYLADKATVEPRVGGKIDFGWEGAQGRAKGGCHGPIKILELEPDHKLSYSWLFQEETVVTWVLEDSEGGTRLTLVHSGFGKDRSTDDYTCGWSKFINSLKSMVEIGDSWQEVQVEKSDGD
jgi:uncharacterized protein YndB with AHSA1/START domain